LDFAFTQRKKGPHENFGWGGGIKMEPVHHKSGFPVFYNENDSINLLE
jgi:hypothetical protein